MSKGLQKIKFTFGEKGLTYFAGIPIIYQFCKSLQPKRFFQQYLHLSHRNTYLPLVRPSFIPFLFHHCRYRMPGSFDFSKVQWTASTIDRLTQTSWHQSNERLSFGFNSTRLTQIQRIHNLIRQKMFQYPSILTTAILDFNSSVLTVYGHQELAEAGYNPYKHGRRSYHPVFGFESHLKISLNGESRPGKKTNKTEVIPFIKTALEKLPSTIAKSRIRIRMDAGFYCWPTVKFLADQNYGYALVAQVTNPIKMRLPGLRYRIFNHQLKLAVTEFQYQPHGWKRPHHFVVMRYPLPSGPETRQRTLLTLFRNCFNCLHEGRDVIIHKNHTPHFPNLYGHC